MKQLKKLKKKNGENWRRKMKNNVKILKNEDKNEKIVRENKKLKRWREKNWNKMKKFREKIQNWKNPKFKKRCF